ncbi:MAG: FAD-dependent oxidoreductase [Actinomycetaceae bacterium]|nr:FAD-dependent oxidoreductase [Actinomycetaceae bacterium]
MPYPTFSDLPALLSTKTGGIAVPHGSHSPASPSEINADYTVDAVVIGGGVAGLTTAYELTKQGLRPLVCEARSRPGGLVACAPVGNITVDIGAESYATRTDDVRDLCNELGLESIYPQGHSWVYQQKHGGSQAVPIPHGMLGIPANLDDPVLKKALTSKDLERARHDLSLPCKDGSDAQNLGDLVETRLGSAVVEKLVRPIAGGIYSSDPYDLALSNVAPGVIEAMKETGSLTAAVAQLRGLTPTKPAVAQPVGGMFRLIDTLAQHIRDAGGVIVGRTIGTTILRCTTSGYWLVNLSATEPGATPADLPIPTGKPITVATRRLVLATTGSAALALLDNNVDLKSIPNWELPEGGPIAHVTFAVRDRRLNDGPRGSGMLVSAAPKDMSADDCPLLAKALTHYSYKWAWPLEADEPDTHVFRVSYGRAGEDTGKIDAELGIREAGVLLGVPLHVADVIDAKIIHWDKSLPPFTPQHRERVAVLMDKARAAGINVVGAWVAGSGLAAVIKHAREQAATLVTC